MHALCHSDGTISMIIILMVLFLWHYDEKQDGQSCFSCMVEMLCFYFKIKHQLIIFLIAEIAFRDVFANPKPVFTPQVCNLWREQRARFFTELSYLIDISLGVFYTFFDNSAITELATDPLSVEYFSNSVCCTTPSKRIENSISFQIVSRLFGIAAFHLCCEALFDHSVWQIKILCSII